MGGKYEYLFITAAYIVRNPLLFFFFSLLCVVGSLSLCIGGSLYKLFAPIRGIGSMGFRGFALGLIHLEGESCLSEYGSMGSMPCMLVLFWTVLVLLFSLV